MGKNRLITDGKLIAKIFNGYYTSIIKHLHIERSEFDPKHVKPFKSVLSAVNKFQNHPSLLKIKSNQTYSGFSFQPVNYEEVLAELKDLDVSETTQLEGIPGKLMKEDLNIFAIFLVKDIMHASERENFLIN